MHITDWILISCPYFCAVSGQPVALGLYPAGTQAFSHHDPEFRQPAPARTATVCPNCHGEVRMAWPANVLAEAR